MFAINSAERARLRYVKEVRHLLADTFGLSDADITKHNEAWSDWLGVEQRVREGRDLQELLKTTVSDAFKARALAILLAPNLKLSPLEWRDKTSLDNYLMYGTDITLPALSPELRAFTIALLTINVREVLAHPDQRAMRAALSSYNRYILQALALLPEDELTAMQLFACYELNDPIEFWGPDEASGYNPFYDMLQAAVPEKWKKLADAKMREVILAEQDGRAQPRNDWEDALSDYTRHIKFCLAEKQFPYSFDLFASQVDFIIRYGKSFPSYRARTALAMLYGEDRKDLRHRFARYITFLAHDDHGAFWVYDEDTRAAATMMLSEFGEKDSDLGDRLRKVLAEADKRTRESQAAAEARQTQINAVLARMS